jgi:RNA-binding protein YhbY
MQLTMQLGKNGLTQNLLEEIKKRFQNKKIRLIKICVLRSARESKTDVKKYSDQIQEFLGSKYRTRTLGFSIFIKK